jgi:hypothetical protein
MEPSTSSRPSSPSPRAVAGAIAFKSTSSGVTPCSLAARAISAATAGAASGGTIESTTSASRTTAPRSGSSSIGAVAASRAVRSLRPSSVATTRAPPRTSAAAIALPMAPGLTTATAFMRRVYDDARPAFAGGAGVRPLLKWRS